MAKTMPVTVTLPSDLVKAVNRMAREQQVSRSALVTDALRRRTWLWRFSKLQEKARPYAVKAVIKTEEDVERLLES